MTIALSSNAVSSSLDRIASMKAVQQDSQSGLLLESQLEPAELEATFRLVINWLQDCRRTQGQAHEQFTLSLRSENSQFWRFNRAKVRQAGEITDAMVRVTWIAAQRSSYWDLPLSGDWECDRKLLEQAVQRLRENIAQLPENPYLVQPTGARSSHEVYGGQLLHPEHIGTAILDPVQGLDFVGIYAAGWSVRAYADSIGQFHWFCNESFSLDYSLFSPNGQAVKGIYAGETWDQDRYEQTIVTSIQQLKRVDRAALKIKPGKYRTYLAPSALPELVQMMSWGGVSESDLQQGNSWLLGMRQSGRSLSSKLTLRENFSRGGVPRFNEFGEIVDEQLTIVDQGQLRNTLISSRTAQEYGLVANGATQSEDLRAPEILPGTLSQDLILPSLDRGIYVSNLHYLNWSDRSQGRVTGMTRYACFWVEEGEIVAPIEHLRFDDSLYRVWGDNLMALTDTQACIPNVATYECRSLETVWTPGMLIEDFTYTL